MLSLAARAERARCRHQRRVTGCAAAAGIEEGVLEPDARVEPAHDGVGDQDPSCFAVAVLQPRCRDAELVEAAVDAIDAADGFVLLEFDRLDEHTQYAAGQPRGGK